MIKTHWKPRGGMDSAWAAAIVIGLVSLVHFHFFRAPPMLADALDYFSAAWELPDTEPTHRHLRIGLLWPLWALQRVFGYSELAYYFLPWFASAALGFATWWLGRLLFSARVGWVAGLVVMLLPPYAAHISLLLPDYLSAALFVFVVCLLWVANNRREASAGGATWVMFLAGVLLGWSYLVREFIVLFFPAVGAMLLLLRAPPRHWLAFSAGAILMYLLEFAWGWIVYGDPFIRLQSGGARETALEFSTSTSEIVAQFITRFTPRSGGWLIGGAAILGLLAMAAGAIRRQRSFAVLAVWGLYGWILFTAIALLPVLILEEGTTYLRMHLFRYWSLILAPVFVAAAAAGFAIYDRRRGAGGHLLAAAGLLMALMPLLGAGLGLKQLARHPQLVQAGATDYDEFREYIANGTLPDVVWMDTGTTVSADKSLPMYMRSVSGRTDWWDGEVRYVNSDRTNWLGVSEIQTGYVLFDRTRAERIYNRFTPDYYRFPESTWEVVFRSSNGRVLVLDPGQRISGAEASVHIAPTSLALRDTIETDKGVRAEPHRGGGLAVLVPEGKRAVLTDDAARGFRPPPAGRNLVPPGTTRMAGTVVTEPVDGATFRLSVRCMFYDEAGERETRAARIADSVSEAGGARERHAFRCDVPRGDFETVSARLLVQLSSDSGVILHAVNYGFTGAP